MGRLASLSAVVVVALFSLLICPASAQEAPDALIRRLGQEVLSAAGNGQATDRAGQQRILGLVEAKVFPYVDFTWATTFATMPYWRDATPEQRNELTNQFREMIQFAIAGAIGRAPYDSMDVDPVHLGPDDTHVQVRARVVRRTGAPIPLIYDMQKRIGAGWKVDDVSVAGAGLIQSYRSFVAAEISKGGIDGLIMTLKMKNKQRSAALQK